MSLNALTRRGLLAAFGGVTSSAIAGCLQGGQVTAQGEFDVYLVSYHWGFAAFDEDGTELDVVEIPVNTTVTFHAVNDHAGDAIDQLPGPVQAEIEHFDPLARTRARIEAGELPEPEGATVEEVYEEAHGRGHEHDEGDGHNGDNHNEDEHDDDHDEDDHNGTDHDEEDGHNDEDDGHNGDAHDDDGHGDGARTDHGFMIREFGILTELDDHAHAPVVESVLVTDPGIYEVVCATPCGYYHELQRADLIHVIEESEPS